MPVQPGTLLRRRPYRQLRLDLGDPPRTARHRPAQPQREADALYRAVQILRAAGHRVYGCGALHQVDERLLTTADLIRLRHADPRCGRFEGKRLWARRG
ncbi:hypothetical protein [Azospirillum doebereinerae]|uniref:Uncharacterized protein n=1 Tax=Azospirillum doebereinerae TaxID=92933 RepID=A0A433J035_9PROT|nr:hypothetical protein [Azospirillum doebereinerae]RUQ61984.1 hypothetical protein EJ913_29320 [Azospirillum doebereinerae]